MDSRDNITIKMKKRGNKKNIVFLAVLLSLFLFTTLAGAFGVSTPYWNDNPLKMAPGESTIVNLTLQNMVGDDDVTLKAEITNNGQGIASLVNPNEVYLVPLGSDNVNVQVRVTIPEDYAIGGVRKVEISFLEVSGEGSGMVSVSGGFTNNFPVNVVVPEESVLYSPPAEPITPETPATSSSNKFLIILIILIILLVAAVVAYILKKRE